jgi:hypothetical protein
VRDADGEPMSRTPGRRRSFSSPADTRQPSPAAFPRGARQGPGSLGWLWRLELQHHALWGGPRARARCALAVGCPRCSRIALTPPAPFTYANTRRLPPHLTQVKPVHREGPAQSFCPVHSRRPLPPRFLPGRGDQCSLGRQASPCAEHMKCGRATKPGQAHILVFPDGVRRAVSEL